MPDSGMLRAEQGSDWAMAFGATCDRCGGDLLGSDVRYTVNLDIAQAFDPMEVAPAEQRREMRGELEAAIRTLEALPASEVQRLADESYASFRFDLCPGCAAALRDEAKACFRGRQTPRPPQAGETAN
ncbi:MAG: hypothetical protein HS116_05345 [Planctomycetes bacterium]|nr:hypothetical protein [Planctomycetota bacterium]